MLGVRAFERCLVQKLISDYGKCVVKSALGLLLKPLALQFKATPPRR